MSLTPLSLKQWARYVIKKITCFRKPWYFCIEQTDKYILPPVRLISTSVTTVKIYCCGWVFILSACAVHFPALEIELFLLLQNGNKQVFIFKYLRKFLQMGFIFHCPQKAAQPSTRSDGCERQLVGQLKVFSGIKARRALFRTHTYAKSSVLLVFFCFVFWVNPFTYQKQCCCVLFWVNPFTLGTFLIE